LTPIARSRAHTQAHTTGLGHTSVQAHNLKTQKHGKLKVAETLPRAGLTDVLRKSDVRWNGNGTAMFQQFCTKPSFLIRIKLPNC